MDIMLFEVLLLPSRLILPVSIRFPQLLRRAAIARFYLVPLATTNTNKCSSNVVAIIYRVINCRCFSLIFFSMSLSVSLKKRVKQLLVVLLLLCTHCFLCCIFVFQAKRKRHPPTEIHALNSTCMHP